jgi:hypothetical protein
MFTQRKFLTFMFAALVATLFMLPSVFAEQALPAELISVNPKKRVNGIQMVVKNNQLEASEKLQSMARYDKDPQVRRFACWAMGKLNMTTSIPALRWIKDNDYSPVVVKAAIRSLARMKKPSAPDPLPPPPQKKKGKKGVCEKDTDCKGNRVCEKNVCRAPKVISAGWAFEASIIGFVTSGLIGGLTIYAALNTEQLLPAIPLAAGATTVVVIAAPAVKSGSKSARENSPATGSLTLRVIGWISFGFHLGGSLTLAGLIPLHWLREETNGDRWTPPASWIIGNGILGIASVISLSIDSLIAHKQAIRFKEEHEREKKAKQRKVSWMPVLAPITDATGTAGIYGGISGSF